MQEDNIRSPSAAKISIQMDQPGTTDQSKASYTSRCDTVSYISCETYISRFIVQSPQYFHGADQRKMRTLKQSGGPMNQSSMGDT